jgi:hypothetical protein
VAAAFWTAGVVIVGKRRDPVELAKVAVAAFGFSLLGSWLWGQRLALQGDTPKRLT